MIKVIGVRFRTAGKIYFFDPVSFAIKKGDHVIVETARGIEYGTVVSDTREVEDDKVVQPLKPVIRIATERDYEQEEANKAKEKDAYRICQEKIRKHGLEMKLIDAEYTFDNNKVLFYFTADGRIDFRELVKDLASVFKTRIELRQIGVRDETKIVGGIGICGRPLCCHSYLSDFIPVSIKMAKEQNLSLNPTKISGVCGRLMCCLKNEEETYEELNRRLPNLGDYVVTEDGLKGEVQSVNVLRQLVKVIVEVNDEKEIREYEVDKLSFKRKRSKKEKMELSKEELEELERLEKEELAEKLEQSLEAKPEKRPDARPERRQDNRQNRRQGSRQEGYTDKEHESRPDPRQEGPGDKRRDSRPDPRQEGPGDKRRDSRPDLRQEGFGDKRRDSRPDLRQEGPGDKRRDSRPDPRQEGAGDKRRDSRPDPRQNGSADKKRESKPEGRTYNRPDSRRENKPEGRQDREKDKDKRNDERFAGKREGRPQHRDKQGDRQGRKQQNHGNQSEG